MSYVAATKQLLGADLSNLIANITKHEKGSSEFGQLEEFAWHEILQKYRTSVSDRHVKSCIDSFVQKFQFHGFEQKARNLEALVEHYSKLDYFKTETCVATKWSLILLLIRLSYRPTDAINDDAPLDINELVKEEQQDNAPNFDWTAYLKEGWEKFKLPSDDGSIIFSDEEDRRNDFDLDDIPSFRDDESALAVRKLPTPKPELTAEQTDAACEEVVAECGRWIESQCELPWWRDFTFTESVTGKHVVSNFCDSWVKISKEQGKSVLNMRVIREYRIMQELLYVLGTANWSSTYLFDCQDGVYSVKPFIAISSLSPPMFHSVMNTRFCKYLPYVARLNEFHAKVNSLSLTDRKVSNTYVAYAKVIGDILNDLRQELVTTEAVWRKNEGIVTLRKMFDRLQPWFERLEFLSHIHTKAVFPDFTKVETWRCSIRLLSSFLNEMKFISNDRFKKQALHLFLSSIEVYMRVVGCMIKGTTNPDPKEEFLVYKCAETNTLLVRKYSFSLWESGISPSEFWEPFISSCFRAVSSTFFLKQLNKRSTFCKRDVDVGALMEDVLQQLKNLIVPPDVLLAEEPNVQSTSPPICSKDRVPVKPPSYSLECDMLGNQLMSTFFDKYYEPQEVAIAADPPVDRFMKYLNSCDISTFPISVFVVKLFTTVILKYMEPEGFALDALINEYKLLDHLRCLRRVFFIQILEPFVFPLFHKVVKRLHGSCDWTTVLRDSITDYYDQKTADQYQCFISMISLIDVKSPKFVHESLSFCRIVYHPDEHLKVVIPVTCIKAYNDIFKFLLQVKWAHHIVTKQFRLRGVEETPKKLILYKRVYLLRMRLVNTMTCFRNYFFSMDEQKFEEKMKKLCIEARDLQTIERAHEDFLVECKLHCFLNRKNPCRILVEALLVLSFKFVKLWCFNSEMTIWDVEALEEEYHQTMKNLITQLHKYEIEFTGLLGSHFPLFQSELLVNLPRCPPTKAAQDSTLY